VREVIQKLIATEQEARDILERARQECDAIVRHAQARAQEILQTAQQQARMEADQLLQTARQQAAAEEREGLARADAEIESQMQLNPIVRQRAVRAVVRCVCRQD
jgi:vacuolar-type H+-ATPase subunit H